MASDDVPNPPPRGKRLVLVLSGVFFSFAPVGTLMQMINIPPGTWTAAVVSSVISGLISTGWASIFMFQRYWLLVPFIALQLFMPGVIFYLIGKTSILEIGSDLSPWARLLVLALMTVGFIIIGFILSIRYTEIQERDATRSRTELDLASKIHQTLVPEIDLSAGGVRVMGRSVPSSQMGGDLIDVVSAGGRVDVYLADVSGHGVKAGVVMAMVKAAIRMRLRSKAELAELLKDLDAVLQDTVEPGMFATFAAMRFEGGPTGSLRASYAMAGHLPILHFRAARGDVADLPNEALPLGVGENELFGETDIACEKGDTFLLYTDGLTEVSDARGRQIGLGSLRETLRAHGAGPLETIQARVLESVNSHGPQKDDQTILLVRVT